MLSHEFMRNAYLAGTLTGLACGLVGYFVVLRSQVFAGDALSHVAFTGALAAAAMGLDPRVGLFAATAGVAAWMGAWGQRPRADDAVTGSIFAWVLGLGALFLSITATGAGQSATTGARVLFGSIFGLSATDAALAAVVGLTAAAFLLAMARPLLFATLDPLVAAARGVPVRALGLGFLVLLGLTTAEATQAVGALLLLGLLAAPAGAVQALVSDPYRGLLASAALSVACVWAGLALSYAIPSLPPSTAIVMLAVGCYVAAVAVRRLGPVPARRGLGARTPGGPPASAGSGA